MLKGVLASLPTYLIQATTVTVANIYYNQPILNKMAETFNVSFERAASVATLMQAGYAGGLLFLCPLGDVLERRPFILGLVMLTILFVRRKVPIILRACLLI